MSIDLPKSISPSIYPKFYEHVAAIAGMAGLQSPFGKYKSAFEFDDAGCAGQELAYTAWFDLVLDNLPGQSAALLRLERLASWGPAYRANFAYCSANGDFETLERLQIPDGELDDAFEYRKRSAVAFNPGNYKRLTNVSRRNSVTQNLAPNSFMELQHDERDRVAVDPQEWFSLFRESGIPCKDS